MPNDELDNEEILAKKAQAFKTIYRAICAGKNPRKRHEDGFLFEHEMRSYEEYLEEVKKQCRVEKNKRGDLVRSAWMLAQKFYAECTCDNFDLFNAIYAFVTNNIGYVDKLYSNARSLRALGAGYFGSSRKAWLVTPENIHTKLKGDPVVWNIHYELACPTNLGELLPSQPALRR